MTEKIIVFMRIPLNFAESCKQKPIELQYRQHKLSKGTDLFLCQVNQFKQKHSIFKIIFTEK